MIEKAKSSRATCRSCGEKIAKDTLRFGEESSKQFGSKPSYRWHHLQCAAEKGNPQLLMNALAATELPVENRAEIEAGLVERMAKSASKFPSLDIAPTGRAKCFCCDRLNDAEEYDDAIAKGSIRAKIMSGGDHGSEKRYAHPECVPNALISPEVDDPIALFNRLKANSYIPDRMDEMNDLLTMMEEKMETLLEESSLWKRVVI